MEPRDLGRDKAALSGIAASVRNIICSSFPQTTTAEKEDVEQEVKLKLWKMFASGKEIGNFRSYLWKVVYTTTLDVLGGRMKAFSLADWSDEGFGNIAERLDLASPETITENKEMGSILRAAVDSLRERRRLVIRLYLADMSLDEISDFLGWSQHKVVHLFYRGLEDLRKKIRRAAGPADLRSGRFRQGIDMASER